MVNRILKTAILGLFVASSVSFASSGSLDAKSDDDVRDFQLKQKTKSDFLLEEEDIDKILEKEGLSKDNKKTSSKEGNKTKMSETSTSTSVKGDVESAPEDSQDSIDIYTKGTDYFIVPSAKDTKLSKTDVYYYLQMKSKAYSEFQDTVFMPSSSDEVALMEYSKEVKEFLDKYEKVKQNNRGSIENSEGLIETEGYCYFPNEVKVGGSDMYYTLPCDLDTLGKVEVFGQLKINAGALMLTFNPLQVRKGNMKFDVVQGYALNGDKTMNNVANEVNERKIEKIGARILTKSAQTAFDSTKTYYDNKNKTTTVGLGGAVVQQNKYPSDYPLVMTATAIAKGVVEGIGELISDKANKMPVLFKIKQGQTVYLYMVVKKHKIGGKQWKNI